MKRILVVAAFAAVAVSQAMAAEVVVCNTLTSKAAQETCQSDADAWFRMQESSAVAEYKAMNARCRPDLLEACAAANKKILDAKIAEANDARARAKSPPHVPTGKVEMLKGK